MGNFYNKPLLKSFGYAIEGIFHAVKFNRNMRIHLIVGLIVLLAGFFLGVNFYEKIILGIMVILVIVSEMVNTSIEEMVNLITTEHAREAKIAKDVAAGMVLVTAVGAIIIGTVIFFPYIANLSH